MNIEEVQRRLWEQSQAHRQHRESGTPLFPTNPYDGRIRNLMDLMHNPTWIAAACDRVLKRSRRKASGVDGVTAHVFAKNREFHLEKLRLELKRGTYRPLPLRRVEIPKANGKMRQLGIPCLRDKIVQEAIRMALEPIFEVEFHENSYGFRPNRSAHHAVARCRQAALTGYAWIIEGDVKACFDEISHKAILRCLREKVMDNKFRPPDIAPDVARFSGMSCWAVRRKWRWVLSNHWPGAIVPWV
jgi:RNA-directed DNA polymerase